MNYLNEEQIKKIRNRRKLGFRPLSEKQSSSAGNPYVQIEDFVDDDVDTEQDYPEPEIRDEEGIRDILLTALKHYKESKNKDEVDNDHFEKLENYIEEKADKYEDKKDDEKKEED